MGVGVGVAVFVVMTGEGLGLTEAVLVDVGDVVDALPEAQPASTSEQATSTAA